MMCISYFYVYIKILSYIYIRIIYYEYLWTPQMSSPVTFKVNWPWGDIRSRCTFTISPSLQANMFQLSMVNLRCQIYTFDSPSRLRWIHLTFIYCCANSYIYLFVNEKTCYIILPWIATYESDWKLLKYRAKLDPLRTFKRLWKKKRWNCLGSLLGPTAPLALGLGIRTIALCRKSVNFLRAMSAW